MFGPACWPFGLDRYSSSILGPTRWGPSISRPGPYVLGTHCLTSLDEITVSWSAVRKWRKWSRVQAVGLSTVCTLWLAACCRLNHKYTKTYWYMRYCTIDYLCPAWPVLATSVFWPGLCTGLPWKHTQQSHVAFHVRGLSTPVIILGNQLTQENLANGHCVCIITTNTAFHQLVIINYMTSAGHRPCAQSITSQSHRIKSRQ